VPRVFLVGDNPASREELRAVLEKERDFEISQAGSDASALELAKSVAPKLILVDTDGQLPKELVETLLQITPDTPIFLIIGAYDERVEKAALRCGVTAVFSKLDDLEALIANARAITEESGRGDAAGT